MTALMPLRGLRIAVTGAGGQLGRYLVVALANAGASPVGFGHHAGEGIDYTVDITDPDAVMRAMVEVAPDCILHAAAYTDVDGCERDPARAEAVNTRGSANIAATARSLGSHLIMISTDFVFPGDGRAPYREDAPVRPLSTYGSSKLGGERAVLETDPTFGVARTAWLYGGAGKHFPRTVLTLLRDREKLDVVTDEVGSPTFAGDVAGALVTLAAQRASGMFHLVNEESTSRFGFAQAVAQAAGLDPARIEPTTSAAFLARSPLPARRPADSTLANTRGAALGITLRPWHEALVTYVPHLVHELGLDLGSTPLASLEGISRS